MCKQDFVIRFCTCEPKEEDKAVVHNKTSRRFKVKFDRNEYFKKHLVWSLRKYSHTYNSGIDGRCVTPVHKLTEDLTSDYLQEQLNSNNLFDFDYIPFEGDCLSIRFDYVNQEIKKKEFRPPLWEYIVFIYRDGKWVSDYYDSWDIRLKDYKNGKLEILQHTP